MKKAATSKKSVRKKAGAKPEKTRTYDNSARTKKTRETEKLIITKYVELLAEQKGAEVPIERLAEVSKVSQRTIFRLFQDKKALQKATDLYIQYYVEESFKTIQASDIFNFARQCFLLYEQYEGLTMAYMFSPFGIETRLIFRKRLNQLLIAQIMKMKQIDSSRDTETKLAVIVSMINAKLWYDIRTDFHHTSEEIGEAIVWALKKLLDDL